MIILDPMLATGGSGVAGVNFLKQRGCTNIKFMSIIAAPEGIEKLTAAHPDIQLYCGCVDEKLNENGYIVPGLGDAGDRIFGTKQGSMIKIKKLLKKIFSQIVLVAVLLLLQIAVLVIGIWKLSRYFAYIYAGLSLLSLVVLVRIMNKKDNPSYKLAWAIPIAMVPVFGGLFYLIIGTQNVRREFRRRLAQIKKDTAPYLQQDPETLRRWIRMPTAPIWLPIWPIQAVRLSKHPVTYFLREA